MARGRSSRGGSSNGKTKPKKNANTNISGTVNTSPACGARSMEDHLAAIDHHWNSLTPKSKAFLLEHKSITTLTWNSLMDFWSQPDQVYYAQMAVSVGTSHLLAYEYYHIKAYSNAAILALNGAFLQQCINKESIDEIKNWPAEKITKENLPHFHAAQEVLSKGTECLSRYLAKVLPLRYQKLLGLEGHASHVPGMGYVDLISNDWNTTSHGSSNKHHQSDGGADEAEIKIVFSNQDDDTHHEKTIKPSVALKSVFNAYAEETGVSLRSLRFSYKKSTLFLSSLGQKSARDLGMKDLDVISIFSNNSSSMAQEQPSPQVKKQTKKKSKPASTKKHQAKEKPRIPPKTVSLPTEKELKEAHSMLLSKVLEEAEPTLKLLRRKLNELVLDCQGPKKRHNSSKKKDVSESTALLNPNLNGLGGKAGKSSYVINVGRVENLYISSKRNSIHNRSSISTACFLIDLHGCNREEAIARLDNILIEWMDTAMKGEYPWVIQAIIICGCGNQILSEVVEAWIKGKKNVANAPRGSLLCQ